MSKALYIVLLFLAASYASFSQTHKFEYKRDLPPTSEDGWHAIQLPVEVFRHVQKNLNDLRVFDLNKVDTIETPYVLQINEERVAEEVINLSVINKSTKDGKLFMTFQVPQGYITNHLSLKFNETNFDGSVTLAGSMDQNEWFNVINDQRILSIANENVNFTSTVVTFPETNYAFLRIEILINKPLQHPTISFKRIIQQPGKQIQVEGSLKQEQNKERKHTVVYITLNEYQPIDKISFSVKSESDYYRPITIATLADSVKTPKGWLPSYQVIYNGYLTSLQNNEFKLPLTYTKYIKVSVDNFDNPQLAFVNAVAAGPTVDLVAQLKKDKQYSLFYGHKAMEAPVYDLLHFKERIPSELPTITPLEEQFIGVPSVKISPLFESKHWLWIAMGVIILILGYFTLKMMKAKD